jgi:hypothetical protein
MNTPVAAIGGFLVILVLLVLLRAKTGNKLDIKSSDIVLALVPIGLWLFLSGKVQEFAFGDFKIVAAIKEASKSPVGAQVTALPVVSLQIDAKSGVDQISNLIAKKSEALSFRLGHGGYYGPAISEYMNRLTQYPFLRYVIISDADGNFFCLADARQLAAWLRESYNFDDDFARWLNSGDKSQLSQLPGFIAADQAMMKASNRRRALQLMDSLDVQTLPVIDEQQQFVGVIDRSKLTASMLIDIADRVEAPQ